MKRARQTAVVCPALNFSMKPYFLAILPLYFFRIGSSTQVI